MLSEKYELCLVLAVTCAVVIVLNIHTELTSRAAFLWKREMAQQQREAASLREKNESLVSQAKAINSMPNQGRIVILSAYM